MKRALLRVVLLFAGVTALAVPACMEDKPRPAPPPPLPAPPPLPSPQPKPCPGPRPCPPRSALCRGVPPLLSPSWPNPLGASVRQDMLTPAGQPIALEYPPERHRKNQGGSDGAGLCVFYSMTHAGDWSSEPVFAGIGDWMRKRPGGGYPEKVDEMVRERAQELRLPVPRYLQVEGADLGILALAISQGYMPSITYSVSPTGRYGGRRIYHMTNALHLDENGAGVLDNNFPGTVEWSTVPEFQKSYSYDGKGWAVILLHPGPPPAPWRAKK